MKKSEKRTVCYGGFANEPLPEWDPDLPIGLHNIMRRQIKESLKKATFEYYITFDGHSVVIDDATVLEKMFARIKFLFNPNKRLIVGVKGQMGDKIPVGDGVYTYSIKTKRNKKGKTVIDTKHYKETLERGKQYQIQKENERYTRRINSRRAGMKSIRDSEIKMLKMEGMSSDLLKLPIVQDIIDYELKKVYFSFDGKYELLDRSIIRLFFSCKKGDTIVITSATKNLLKDKIYDAEYYRISRSNDGYKIEIGERNGLCPDGLCIYADKDGNMTKAEFRISLGKEKLKVINIPMSKPCLDGLEYFIYYQRRLEKIADELVIATLKKGLDKGKAYKIYSLERKRTLKEILREIENLKQYNPKRNILR